ncbi:hypothetical protein [Streptomyces sp. bgisy091]|uniref:hypothetical protein n=1 Tax=Streptomyces sp. bgisy091 TaxID=3413778 RepID=UPI003D761D0E
MIAGGTVARWTWGCFAQDGEPIAACLQTLMAAVTTIEKSGRLTRGTYASVAVHEAGLSNSYLFRGNLRFDSAVPSSATARHLTTQMTAYLRSGEIGSVYASLDLAGAVTDGDRGTDARSSVQLTNGVRRRWWPWPSRPPHPDGGQLLDSVQRRRPGALVRDLHDVLAEPFRIWLGHSDSFPICPTEQVPSK